ncbi:phosphate ABC transporter substrate-binding protein (PhoT family) [Volucribacter psittacicida]|uniref:Phosphate-binding protein PstS n=2 Tax=Volucribacter psittacicida TaxID=203482 RepID=A0A4R1GBV0_9PAST|nr:phosphate ABC transporter substrate-binding protein (PhoT family) [Volucribacter psittacicida]
MLKTAFRQTLSAISFLILVPFTTLQAADITGAGASFPYPIYAKWTALYQQQTGNKVNYQSIGSGGGQQQIIAKTIDFAGSDDPMSGEALEQHQLLQFPAIIGGIVPVVNLPELSTGVLKLSGEALAQIYLGHITHWNDPAIQQLNPELSLPNKRILVVHRSDGSGTTFGWTNYLSKVSPQWQAQVGEGKAVKWPTGQGAKGNEGVSAYVKQLKYSIGYVEYAYAKQNQLAWVSLQNKSGNFVQPNQASFSEASANADWQSAVGMGVILTDQQGDNAWPITAASFILLPKTPEDYQQNQQVLQFFDWAFHQGQQSALALDYVPLPAKVVEQVQWQWQQQLKDHNNQAIWQMKK